MSPRADRQDDFGSRALKPYRRFLLDVGWDFWTDDQGEWWAPPEEQPDHVGRFGMRLHEAIEQEADNAKRWTKELSQ